MQYAIFMTTDTSDVWLADSVSDTLPDLADYIARNRRKLDAVAGPNGDWSAHHYEPGSGKRLSELQLTWEERRDLWYMVDDAEISKALKGGEDK